MPPLGPTDAQRPRAGAESLVDVTPPQSLGRAVVRLEGSVPVIVLPDDLRFDELKEWIRERVPGSLDSIGARSCRLDIGAREIQLFDLRRLLHLLRDEFGVDATGLYLRSDAILRYAERELKLKLFPTDSKLDPPKAAETPATVSPAAGAPRSDAPSGTTAKAENPGSSAGSPAKPPQANAGEGADDDAMHLPGIADLQALLGSGDADTKPGSKEPGSKEAPPAAFEPADAVRRSPQAAAPAEAEAESDGSTRTLTLRRTLRSGAAIHFEGDVIVVGDVNAGAQIRAAGNIIVLGKLRGVVHAGAQGDETSFILAFDLAPTQLRIARHIAIAPARAASDDAFRPEIATVADAAIVIEPWRGTRRR